MFTEFRWAKNTDKVPSDHYFSPDRPVIMKWLMVDLSWKKKKKKKRKRKKNEI